MYSDRRGFLELELGTKRTHALTIYSRHSVFSQKSQRFQTLSWEYRPTYSCDGSPGSNKMDAPGNGLLTDTVNQLIQGTCLL